MSSGHLLRKATLICQTSSLVDSMTDAEIMSAISYVYDLLAGGRYACAQPDGAICIEGPESVAGETLNSP